MTDDEKDKLRSIQSLIEQVNTRLFIAALEGKLSDDSRERMKSRLKWVIENL